MPILLDKKFTEQEAIRALKSTGPTGSMIPGLMNTLNDFVANPDSVSVYTYQRMLETDETVGAAVDLLVRSVVGRLGDYAHPDPKITEFVNAAFTAMEGTIQSVAREIMTAKWAGFSVTEKVLAMGAFEGRPVIAWERLQTLPPGSIAFEVDKHGQVTKDGIFQFAAGVHATPEYLLRTAVVQDSWAARGNKPWPERMGFKSGNWVSIPKARVVHYPTGSPLFGNPYGRSPLRRAYKSWMIKDLVLRMLLVALDRKGTPLLVAHAPEGEIQVYDHNGQKVLVSNDPDVPLYESAQVALARQLANIHNESSLILGDKEEYGVEAVKMGNAGEEFLPALNYLNRAIVRSMLLPSLIFEEGVKSGSHALGTAHLDTFNTVVTGELEDLESVIIDQLVKELVIMNFGEQKQGYGGFQPIALSSEEKSVLGEMFTDLIDSGIVRPTLFEDWEMVRLALDLPASREIFEAGEAIDELDEEDDEDLTPEEKEAARKKREEDDEESELAGGDGPSRIVILSQFGRRAERERAERERDDRAA